MFQCPSCKFVVRITVDGFFPFRCRCGRIYYSHADGKSQGVGDTIEKLTHRVGIKPCGGCKKRRDWLNKNLPYRDYLAKHVTACITHYKRPDDLQKLLDSLAKYYPKLKILTQDTGGNLSWGRNQLAKRCKTKYYLMLEEDFIFTDQTDLRKLLDVLESDETVQGCAGAVVLDSDNGKSQRPHWWAHDCRMNYRRLDLVPSSREAKVTPHGTVYYPCDVTLNFGIYRTQLIRKFPFPESLPVYEHTAWYWSITKQFAGTMAAVPVVRCRHTRSRPSTDYRNARRRLPSLSRQVWQEIGAVTRTFGIFPHDQQRPSVLVLGVAHSGTSIFAELLHSLGWNIPDRDKRFNEIVKPRQITHAVQMGSEWDEDVARKCLRWLATQEPYCWKDPRMVRFLYLWLPLISEELERKPVLVWITRDTEAIKDSFKRRKEGFNNGNRKIVTGGKSIEANQKLAEEHFALWPWLKLGPLRIEDIDAACRLWEPGRVLK